MIRATRIEPSGARHGLIDDEVTLDFDQRHRRRMTMTGARGVAFLLDLEKAHRIRSGDTLVLEDGRRVRVLASPEPLAEITFSNTTGLARIAWHLGNRHLPTMIFPDRLIIRRDHVIEDMVQGLGASVVHIEAPFDPEAGAYAGGHHHHHVHETDDGHEP